jgi:hypothetical protein
LLRRGHTPEQAAEQSLAADGASGIARAAAHRERYADLDQQSYAL